MSDFFRLLLRIEVSEFTVSNCIFTKMSNFHIYLVGDKSIGKTFFLRTLMSSTSPDQSVEYECGTIAINHVVDLPYQDSQVHCIIRDGSDSDRVISAINAMDYTCIVVCYDVSEPISSQNCYEWINKVYDKDKRVSIFLLGLKSDLDFVDPRTPVKISNQYGIPHMRASAKDCESVQAVFQEIITLLLKRGKLNVDDPWC